MTRVLFIIAQQGFRDEELLDTKSVLENNGKTCKIASITHEIAVGSLGARVIPDLAIKEASAEEFDSIVVVGGPGSIALANYPEVIDLIKRASAAGKIICAICAAPVVLAAAGILAGKKVTVFPNQQLIAALVEAGAKYISDDVVVDGKLVTANGPKAAKVFGEAISRLV